MSTLGALHALGRDGEGEGGNANSAEGGGGDVSATCDAVGSAGFGAGADGASSARHPASAIANTAPTHARARGTRAPRRLVT